MSAYYIGLMTGTSVDAIDAVILEFDEVSQASHLVSSLSEPLPEQLRNDISALFTPADNEIDRLGEIDIELSKSYAELVHRLLAKAELTASDICAIGSHGQTIRHRPHGCTKKQPFTLQIGDPNTLAVQTGITVIADFRRKDMALGGQGAPLAPAYHAYMLGNRCDSDVDTSQDHYKDNCAVLNIGGIANVSIIQSDGVTGFDTGPGNALLDYWFIKHKQGRFDEDGAWARSGTVIPGLLNTLLSHEYFAKCPPKSTGKEEFSAEWLQTLLITEGFSGSNKEDIQRTLTEYTAQTIASEIKKFVGLERVYVCGGGWHNLFLIERLRALLEKHTIDSTAAIGLAPEWIEASAFAWLAKQTMDGLPGNQPSITGASRAAILGGIYLA